MMDMTGDDLSYNDAASGDLIVVSLPSHGKIFGDNGELAVGDTFSNWSYTPNSDITADEGWHGVDTWSYTVRESCEDSTTRDSTSATVSINVPEVDMIIHHGQGGAAVDKTKEEVKNKLLANGTPEVDANGNKIKLGEGAFTVANLNDTDNDGHADYTYDDHEANAGHAAANGRPEIDLIEVVLKKPSIYNPGGTVNFEVTYGNGTSDSAKIWKDKFREDEADVSVSFSFGESESQRTYWVELISPSAEIGDYHFSYSYEGGFTDYASATAVWASITAVAHDRDPSKSFRESADAILNDPAWAEVNGGAKVDLEKGIPPGLSTAAAPGYGIHNGIYQRWTVTPPRINQYQNIVKVDLARRIESAYWSIWDDDMVVSFIKTAFDAAGESANDDTTPDDESNELTASDHFFVVDIPGHPTADPPSDGLQYWIWKYNFQEFVRIGIGTRPSGINPAGSRASDYFDWHARHYLKEFSSFYWRVPVTVNLTRNYVENDYNDVGSGHISIGDEPADWLPRPFDAEGQ
ncbi:MAG TPA: hypothetical protein P5307_06785 [Pirellulaceae bacterium]|nr:hypothetical protein [Pirellulaceae bacterium]